MPVGRALDAEPVDVAVLVDIGQPRHLGKFGVAIVDQRMDFRPAEAAPESGKLGGAEILVTKHQHRVLGEGGLDPGERVGIERLRQIDADCLGSECLSERAKFACVIGGSSIGEPGAALCAIIISPGIGEAPV